MPEHGRCGRHGGHGWMQYPFYSKMHSTTSFCFRLFSTSPKKSMTALAYRDRAALVTFSLARRCDFSHSLSVLNSISAEALFTEKRLLRFFHTRQIDLEVRLVGELHVTKKGFYLWLPRLKWRSRVFQLSSATHLKSAEGTSSALPNASSRRR